MLRYVLSFAVITGFLSVQVVAAQPGGLPPQAAAARDDSPSEAGPQTSRPPLSVSDLQPLLDLTSGAGARAKLVRLLAEGFHIPTGAMAPTLLGPHREFACPECGYRYRVSASEEMAFGGGPAPPEFQVVGSTCPMCRAPVQTDKSRLFQGDRIMVSKVTYLFNPPQRWDVAVFKYPGDPRVRYVKRVVGLPNETVRIRHGDIFIKRAGDAEFTIARRPPQVVRAMLQLVHDNDYVAPKMIARGWPARWQPVPAQGAGQWVVSKDYRSFQTDGKAVGETWIRYQHFVLSAREWEQLRQ